MPSAIASRSDIDALLRGVGADDRPHSGRTLYAHLRGTERLLRRWGCDEATCLAGMFHSIYGTGPFPHACMRAAERRRLADHIGAEAEHLVYLFHVGERPGALLTLPFSGTLRSRLTGDVIRLSELEIQRLIEIECANLIEQNARAAPFFDALDDAMAMASFSLRPALARVLAQRRAAR